MKTLAKICLMFLLTTKVSANNSICTNWFKDLKLRDKNCELSCMTAKIDISTSLCHNQCETLCKSKLEKSKNGYILDIVSLYPGLTDAEKNICSKEPAKCLTAYKLSWDAEKLCLAIYNESLTNDESDACRHFVWASLLQREFRDDFPLSILNAHEQNIYEPENQRSMDLANNRIAIIKAQKIIKLSEYTDQKIISEFKKSLEQNELVILKPRGRK